MKGNTILGGSLIIIGFLLYQTGISIAFEKSRIIMNIFSFILQMLQINLSIEPVSVVLEFLGGMIAIIGFLQIISNLTPKDVVTIQKTIPNDRKKPEFQGLLSSPSSLVPCRFCGKMISKDDLFCQHCKKALQ